ncbi:MAG: V-type ATP synthase subunit F [Candidatus Cryosericum sp.]|jgi:V/A-type H+-transporting ATPase subunit F|nr:V-type ATP synthase subunit F [Candidatus Cryosericum sp.]HPS70016.1 V-type ATP synthase subunit F [Candidatus Cryosericum sp.]
MSKAGVVTTRETVGAFEALGFVGRVVDSDVQAAEAVLSLARTGEFGLILLTSDVAGGWIESEAARSMVVPVVLVVPVTSSDAGVASAAVRRLIENAVGIDLVGKTTEEASHDTR